MKTVTLMLFICSAGGSFALPGDCSIIPNQHLSKTHQPVLFVRDANNVLRLAEPETSGPCAGSIKIRSGDVLVLSCPGAKNKLVVGGEGVMTTKCSKDQTFNMDVQTRNLECACRVIANIDITQTKCGLMSMGNVIEVGYEVPGSQKKPLLTVCHNIAESVTYYTNHVVRGPLLKYKATASQTVSFLRGDDSLFAGFDPDTLYKKKQQDINLQKILGNASAYYLSKEFLARGHLAPAADFTLGAWQVLTYLYINTAPQWQSVNVGSWLSTENFIRKLAKEKLLDLDVMTGSSGVLSLEDDRGNPHDIYLEPPRKLPVPLVFWKLVRDPLRNICLGIIAHNNPFAATFPAVASFCTSNPPAGWPALKGIYYCTYSNLMSLIPYIPVVTCNSSF